MSFPSGDRWRELEPYVERALELEDGERAAWLASVRRDAPDVAAELEALLAAGEEASRDDFLGASPLRPPDDSLAGQAVGAYTLIEPIGRGGMGTVWLARRSDGRFEGRVAVKLLNASLVGRAGEERFRREGSILARLTHPNVARLIDAGVSASGQPYIVLEHVDGEPIDGYCDSRRLGVEARLRLFLDVCAAIAQAHANLVVHRDIKPSNVLVTRNGGVKLLDFGIAKLLEEGGAGGQATELTREGGRAMTPEFAAPEQLTGGAVTTATDVHALGTLLYLLLTGRHPAGEVRTNPALLLKAIVETDPRRPSEAATDAEASSRSTTREALGRELRGDLDTITAKALKKEPAERYASVEALAADARRYLAHEPIAARPDTVGYRTAKFVRRHRAAVAAGALAVVAVLSGAGIAVWEAREARRQRDAAETQLDRTRATNDFLGFLLSVAAPPGRKFVVSDLLEQGEMIADKEFPGRDPRRAELLFGIGRQYVGTERWEKAAPVLERAVEIARQSGDRAVLAEAQCSLALTYTATKGRASGEPLMQRTLDELPAERAYAMARAECLTRQAELGFFNDEGAPMVRHAQEALAVLDRAGIRSRTMRLDAQNARAYGYYLERHNTEADRAYAELVRELERSGRDRTLSAADVFNNWSLVHFLGDIRKSETLQRRCLDVHRAIEGEEGVVPGARHNYAGILFQLARYEEAEPQYRETIRSAHATNSLRVELDATLSLAILYATMGRVKDADQTMAGLEPLLGHKLFTNKLRRGFLAYARGEVASAHGDSREARERFAESVSLYDEVEAKYIHAFLARVALSKAELASGNAEAAERAARRALELAESMTSSDSPSYLIGMAQAALGAAQLRHGAVAAGRDSLSKALVQLEQTLGPEHPATIQARGLAAR